MNPGKVMPMNNAQSIDIHCDIDSIEGSFRGELKNELGISRSFSGWTEFATALVARHTTPRTKSKTSQRRTNNMNYIRNMKRPRLATILAGLALFIALGGTAAAAGGLINGKKIKKGTITSKQIKNKTITKAKISPSTFGALAGAKGPQGPKGDKGSTGAKGATGLQGPKGDPGETQITTYHASGSSINNIPANQEKNVINMNNLASGRYVINASVQAFSQGAGTVNCSLNTNGGGGSAGGTWTAAANGRNVIALTHVTDTPTVSHIDVACESSGVNSAYSVEVSAIKAS
ncbi:MAG: collagen-like protein [Solirubrobacterales bacterium]|nr:collagen-like protein [Solirubrobacterales bacterium]